MHVGPGLTGHMQFGYSDDKLSGLGFVGSADIDARMVAPSVPDHQVGFQDNHISRDGLSI